MVPLQQDRARLVQIPVPVAAPVSTAHPDSVNGRARVVPGAGASTNSVALLLVACTVTLTALRAVLNVPVSVLREKATNMYVPGFTVALRR